MFNEFLLTTVLTSISIFLLFLIVCRNSGEKKLQKTTVLKNISTYCLLQLSLHLQILKQKW